MTRDHVVGTLFFRKPLPSDMVVVPACRGCNEAKGKLEEYLRDVLTADVACSANPVVKEIVAGPVSRSISTNRSLLAGAFRAGGSWVPILEVRPWHWTT
jgi:hypothetical protein